MSDEAEDLPGILSKVSADYDADIYLYNGAINDRGYGDLTKAFTDGAAHPNGLLILVTNGGSANCAYQIAKLFQKNYDKLILFTPSYCKSAGTLIALGAHELIMTDFSELGPLDVQIVRSDELAGRKSGLLARSSFESLQETSFNLFEFFMLSVITKSQGLITFKTASELAVNMTSVLMAELFSQINPEIVGSDYRDLRVAVEYGKRLSKTSMNPKPKTVHRLVHDYPSQDFIIDNEEAATLFKSVQPPSTSLNLLIGILRKLLFQEADPTFVCRFPHESEEEENDEQGEEGAAEATDVCTDTPLDDSGASDRRGDQQPDRGSGDEDRPQVDTGDLQADAPSIGRSRRRSLPEK